MFLLILGLAIFFAAHLVPASPRLRDALADRLGEPAYKAAFAAVSLAGLALVVLGMKAGGRHALWAPPPFAHPVATGLMPLAFVFVVAAYFPCNIRRLVRHPMLLGVALWAGLHLLANGDLAGVLLFASFLAYALFDLLLRRRDVPRGPPRLFGPGRDLMAVVVAIALYAALLALHPLLFGHAVAG